MTAAHIKGLTEAEAAGIDLFEKPKPGTWTEAFGLDTDPVDFRESWDPQFYELEREAVFRRSWLQVGRVETLPRLGTYFTKELEFLGLSVLLVRGMDGEIRAFHNVCSHRGNKLMWDDYPAKESKGSCRQIACKYHGWRYDLDGEINYVHNAPEFFDLKAEDLALPKIHVDTWAGFIFINLEKEPRQTLRDYLTPTVAKLESYPFQKMTQTYVLESEINANWKVLMDAFQEIYHLPYLHATLNNAGGDPETTVDRIPVMMPYFAAFERHRLSTSGGPNANQRAMGKRPIDALFRAGFFGPDYTPDVGPLGDGVNPGGLEKWGIDSWKIYPNFEILTYCRNFYVAYSYWPLSSSTHRFTATLNFVPPTSFRERLAQEHTVMTVREFAIQDVNTLEAIQRSIESGVRDKFNLCDQEVLIRHLRQTIRDDVEAYQRELDALGGRG
jgi:phenylpropionate dioxygenase-like ring-hydroxylating dioxygenase large terminal subunit